ncbi:MAG: formylglycine-generating enzyme family protein [Candidatus Nitrotoga sp.]
MKFNWTALSTLDFAWLPIIIVWAAPGSFLQVNAAEMITRQAPHYQNTPVSKPCDSCHHSGEGVAAQSFSAQSFSASSSAPGIFTTETFATKTFSTTKLQTRALDLPSECVTCHSRGLKISANGLTRVAEFLAQDSVPKPSPKPPPKLSADTTALSEAGMRYPLYYDDSRIGSRPNKMVRVPAGSFLMGSNTRLADEGPQHSLTLPTFFIDQYEVTNLQYKAFIQATKHRSPNHFSNRTYPEGKADHPVTFVSWYDAHDYCAWANKRLPTAAEWEKASRGVDGRTFPWGDKFEHNHANTPARWASLDKKGDTTPVGSFVGGISPYGAYDMSGNVWEWTDSWYTAYPGNTRPSENYGEQYKTLKGGSWWDCTFYECGISAPVFNRAFFDQRVKNATFGFRCAKDSATKEEINNELHSNAHPI